MSEEQYGVEYEAKKTPEIPFFVSPRGCWWLNDCCNKNHQITSSSSSDLKPVNKDTPGAFTLFDHQTSKRIREEQETLSGYSQEPPKKKQKRQSLNVFTKKIVHQRPSKQAYKITEYGRQFYKYLCNSSSPVREQKIQSIREKMQKTDKFTEVELNKCKVYIEKIFDFLKNENTHVNYQRIQNDIKSYHSEFSCHSNKLGIILYFLKEENLVDALKKNNEKNWQSPKNLKQQNELLKLKNQELQLENWKLEMQVKLLLAKIQERKNDAQPTLFKLPT